MPPKPWETREQLPPGGEHSTFHESGAHRKYSDPKKKPTPPKRWSYVFQDTPELIAEALNDINKGYILRLAAVVGVTGILSYALWSRIATRQEEKPLAKRWSLFSRPVPITLLEKDRQEGSDVYVYRFALPNSYDYAGYDPVSSVQILSGQVRGLSSLKRWYTPITHPNERGFIEFAIKDCDPGRMSARLRGLQLGDVVYLGRWMKEFDYRKHLTNAAGELGLICTTSGASVALQLMQVIDKNKEDKTKLKVLYCHFTANGIPFKKEYFDKFIERNKERIRVSYNVLSLGGKKKEDGFVLGENTFLGNIDSSTVEATMPPPIITKQIKGEDEKDVVQARRPYMCVCGPQSMLTYVCGRTSPISNYYYWQGWPYRYTGFLKDMGYTRDQVYKFGVSTHFLAVH